MESALRYRMSSNKRSQSNKEITLDLQLTPKGEPVVDPGEGLGGLGPPPYFYTSEARRAEKRFLRPPPHPRPPISRGLDNRPPPPFWRSGSATKDNQDAAQGLFAPKTGESDKLRERWWK